MANLHPWKQESKSQTAVQYDPGTVVPGFCHIPAAQAHCRATERRRISLRKKVWFFFFYLLRKHFQQQPLPSLFYFLSWAEPSAGATQWNTFDFVHPHSRWVSLNQHWSYWQQRLPIILRVLHGNCLQENYTVYVFLLQLTNYLKCQVAWYRNKRVYCML